MDKIKLWLIGVAAKKMGPSAIRAIILALTTWMIAHDGLLNSFGVVYDQTLHTITIYLDKVNMALVLGLPAVIAALIKMFDHHAVETVKSLKQKEEIKEEVKQ